VIPIQGEHPHGLFHVMHGEWRLYKPFIMWCAAALGNRQVVDDPNVSVFNVHRYFFLNVLTRACAEYINEIARTPGADDLDDPVSFIRKAESNLDFAWICHFAHDAGFLVLDFLQAVRGAVGNRDSSRRLDLVSGESFLHQPIPARPTRPNMSQWPSCECFGARLWSKLWMTCIIAFVRFRAARMMVVVSAGTGLSSY